MIYVYPIGKVNSWEKFPGGKFVPKPLDKLTVSVTVDSDLGHWCISFGEPWTYNLQNMCQHTLRNLIEQPNENFYVDMGRGIFIMNQDMQDWIIKASAVAGHIDNGK
jgi:hypothetical protein